MCTSVLLHTYDAVTRSHLQPLFLLLYSAVQLHQSCIVIDIIDLTSRSACKFEAWYSDIFTDFPV